jgi:hypothetical protein
LPRIGDGGFRAVAEQFDDKFTHRGPAADQHAELSSSSTMTQPSTSTQSTTTSTQGAPSTGSTAQTQPSNPTTSQSAPAANSTVSQSAPAASTSPSQAQSNTPAAQPSGTTPAQAQTNNPAPANNQAQQTPNSGTANTNTTAQQPAQSNQPAAAQSSSTNVNASVNINDQQRTRLSQSFARVNVQPLNNVNFSVSVGAAIPRDVRLHPLPADVVEVVPQYRGYNFVMVRDEIVIVDPATYKIVTVLPHSGSTAVAPARSHSKVALTDRDRDVVRRHTRVSTERRTTGSSGAARVEIRRGERVPDTVEIEEFPETVYREAPALREYRYIHRENRTYLVEPTERRVIEEFD